jgi:hypothetical protein
MLIQHVSTLSENLNHTENNHDVNSTEFKFGVNSTFGYYSRQGFMICALNSDLKPCVMVDRCR